MNWVDFITNAAREHSWNDIPRIFYLFLRIAESDYIGRYQLMHELNLTEAIIKTMLEKMRKAGIISAKLKKGHTLTDTGIQLYTSFRDDVPIIRRNSFGDITLFPQDVLFLIKNKSHKISNGMRQRDIAIITCRNIEVGVTTLTVKNREILIPPNNIKVAEFYPEFYKKIRDLTFENNDVIIIGSSKNIVNAYLAGLSSVLDLFIN